MSRNLALLAIDIARKAFGAATVLRDIRLDIRAGEIVALVGPSGCGKSTLLRIAAGLDRGFAGVVKLSGVPVQGPHPAIGLIFQEPRLLPWLSAADNVAFSAPHAPDAQARAASLLAEMGLCDWAAALPKQLSGGMAQRVALARGLYSQPAVLLLDEPFSAVDALTRMRLQDALLGIVQHHGVSALLVTHDVEEAVYLAHRIIILDRAPATIRGEVVIPLARPRRRTEAALGGLRARVMDKLQETHAA